MATDELDPVLRLRAVAAAYPSAGVAEVRLPLSVEEVWEWVTDFERNVPRFDSVVTSVAVLEQPGGGLSLNAKSRLAPVAWPFEIRLDDRFCMMIGRGRLFLVVMAARADGDGTLFCLAEALPRRVGGWLRGRFQAMVDEDLANLSRVVGT